METYVGIAVAILYPHDEVAYDVQARAVAGELLTGYLRIVLLRLDKLVVEVHVVRFAGHELACFHQCPHKQAVQPRCGIEIVAFTCVGEVCRIGDGQFWNTPSDCVGTAGAQGGMKRQVGHQVAYQVLHAVAATEISTRQRTDNLDVPITV